ncbi:MAG TPA: alpha-L-arabinofuranosidase C-terminal domain-containing protein [Chitinophagaceae bacterium]
MKRIIAYFIAGIVAVQLHAQRNITVSVNKPVAAVSPQMWGIFFEDINFGADGGLYAELVKNSSFEFPMPMMGWKEIKQQATGKILIVNQAKENNVNPRYAHIAVDAATGNYGLSNEGFRGVGVHKGEQYDFSVWARKTSGNLKMKIELVNFKGDQISSAVIDNFSDDWKKYAVSFTTSDTTQKGRLNILFEGKGAIDVDRISLFPQKTWKNRKNGLRNDLVQLLADLKPGFIRFPGGCIVEGRDLSNRYQWKKTVGAVEERKLLMNRWNVEFPRRAAPDYYQTFGLGFYEYFLLAEDVGAAPLPIINCGMACQFNSSEVVSMNELDPYVQDALDLIEFANGAVTTKWGKLRAEMGHPSPFHLKLLGVGNEQWDEQYLERYKVFEKVLQQKHPEIKLVAAAGPSPEGARFDYAWKEFKQLHPGFIDEHYYQSPEWFFRNAGRYDNYDRKGPKVFAGEYAAHNKEEPQAESRNTWLSALAEAAFMTGLERNADIVQMSSYAPLLAHVDAWQWRPDLIWFDDLRSVATPNYYVQKLFSVNKGTQVVPALQNGQVLAGKDSLYASAVIDQATKQLIIKLVNAGDKEESFDIKLDGIKAVKKEAIVEELYTHELFLYNTLDQPEKIYPVEKKMTVTGKKIELAVQPRSFTVIKIVYDL